MNKEVFEKYESEVRSYCRTWSDVFKSAKGSIIKTDTGREYIDFFCGAGAVNYGHNNDFLKERVIEYLNSDGIVHSLDMYTCAKGEFIDTFQEKILKPRGFDYKIMFTGPTGTNAVEAALKLARKVKKRSNVFALMGAFHGMTLGSLALTTDSCSRDGAGVPLNNVTHIPAPYMFGGFDTLKYIETILTDDHSGISLPSAIVIETVQAEGGIYVFSNEFLKGLRELCDKYDILLIVDDIQVGCSRTGTFFSFERASIIPDIVIMSKSIGAFGLPFALTLFKRELDIWAPGEHNGTFRGNQLSMVAAKAGLELTINDSIENKVKEKGNLVNEYLNKNIRDNFNVEIRGIGLIWGIDVFDEKLSKAIVSECFENGLILERAGRNNSVVKIMPALTISNDLLIKGLDILNNALEKILKWQHNYCHFLYSKLFMS